jgi:chromosome segregation ATPase
MNRVGMDKQTIAQRYSDASTEYTEALYNFKMEETLARLLKMTLLTRQQRWQLFKRYIAARARTMFTYLLSERGFKGALKINHLEKLLDLKVQPDETKQDRGGQTKGLSGGEKSFSTVCLLWDAIGAPIRCLDEL